MADLPAHEVAWVRYVIDKRDWTRARTYEETYPHEYIVRFKGDREEFDRFHRMITQFGFIQLFFNIPRPYLILDERKYWRMQRNLEPRVQFVINRASPVDKVYGAQWAPDTRRSGPPTRYDWLSVDWPERGDEWVRPTELAEVIALLHQMCDDQTVLNVGCGHGRLLDHLTAIKPSQYVGIDPSQGMLNVHVERHKQYRVWPLTLEEYGERFESVSFDTVLALWGTADHLSEAEIVLADEMAETHLLLIFHGDVEPLEKINPLALDRAQALPGVREARYGRWHAVFRTNRLF